jgi:hypothetical protein
MATFQLRRFSNPLVLRAIDPERLLAFLDPFRDFFAVRGYALPQADTDEEVDYSRLVRIFMLPDMNTPKELLDALFLVDEMSTPEGMDALLEAAKTAELPLASSDDQSPADIALQVWLLDKDIIERKHAEQSLSNSGMFEYFQTKFKKPPVFAKPTVTARKNLEKELDNWFDEKKRGRNCRVFIYPQKDEVAFLVRHGKPFAREESQDGAKVSSVCYRPIKYDVIVYDKKLGELRINSQLVGEKKLYCRQFGKHFFDDEDCFPGKNKYTLEPLREYGSESLACGDVEGIESITLVELEVFWGGAYRVRETIKADDVFADCRERQKEFPPGGRITKAVFKVKFMDSKTPRLVKIKPSNIAKYARESDAKMVEQWLQLRGFIVTEKNKKNEAAKPPLVVA